MPFRYFFKEKTAKGAATGSGCIKPAETSQNQGMQNPRPTPLPKDEKPPPPKQRRWNGRTRAKSGRYTPARIPGVGWICRKIIRISFSFAVFFLFFSKRWSIY